jgi:transitional endoplasmic reticulum ATPase
MSESKRNDSIEISFGKTTSPDLRAAIRSAQSFPGYRVEQHAKGELHYVQTQIPFDDPDTWKRLRSLIETVGRWKTSSVQIGGRDCRPIWRGLHELAEIVECYQRRPNGLRGEDYCRGKETPTADVTAFGCRFVRGVDLLRWGRSRAPWYHFGRLTDDGQRYVVDKIVIANTLRDQSSDLPCQLCQAFSWNAVEAVVAELPDTVEVSEESGYSLRYSDVDASKPIGITKETRNLGLAISLTLPKEFQVHGSQDEDLQRNVPNVRYSDVAGQAEALQAIWDVCELPLKHFEYFDALGIQPHRGVILYGPPGNGKTLLAKAVATESAAHLEIVSGSEVLSKWVGQSEENISQVFHRAKKLQPSVILFDEIDALASSRDFMDQHHQVQVVSQLLVLLDGLEERGRVIVIATTNRLEAIDPAIRRPGRFDYHIEVKLPDRDGRLAILQRHAPAVLSDSSRLLAEMAALCREAGLVAIKRSLAEGTPVQAVSVQRGDFQIALESVRRKRIWLMCSYRA